MPLLDANTRQSPLDPRFALQEPRNLEGLANIQEEGYRAGYIGQGVKAAGRMAEEIHLGYQKGKLQGQIDPYAQRARDDIDSIESATEEFNQIRQKRQQAQASLSTPEGQANYNDRVKNLQSIEGSYVKAIDKLKEAHRQGAMSNKEFEIKVRSLTREAADRNPGYTNELISHARDIYYMSGVRDIQDPTSSLLQEEASAKKVADSILSKQALKYNIFFTEDHLNDPYKRAQLTQEIQQRSINVQLAQDMTTEKAISDHHKNATMPERKAMAYDTVSGAIDTINTLVNDYHSSIENMPITDRRKAYNEINGEVSRRIAFIGRNLAELNIPSTDINTHLKSIKDHWEDSTKIVHDIVDGKATKEDLDIQNKIATLTHKNHLIASGYNKDFQTMLSKNPAVALQYLKKNPKYQENTIAAFDGANNAAAKTFYNSSDVGFTIKSAGVSDDPIIMGKVTTALDQQLKMENLTPMEKKIAAYNAVEALANIPINAPFEFKSQPETQNKLREITNYHFQQSGMLFKNEVGKLAEASVSVETSFNGGLISFKLTNQDGSPYNNQQGFNNKYGQLFNTGIKAYARLYKNTWEQSSDAILRSVGSDWYYNVKGGELSDLVPQKQGATQDQSTTQPMTIGKRGQNENNPLNLKEIGQDRFQQFGNKLDGIKASYNQLMMYHEGRSKNVSSPVTVPEQMLKIWNNQNEKGSASDSQYAKNVAAYSGIDLLQPIDKNDIDSWVDLVYGMAKAEGAKNITRKEIRLALKGNK